jgi:hypothetical protein
MNFSVWPYEELTVRPGKEGRCLFFTPWFARSLQIREDLREDFLHFFARPADFPPSSQGQFWTALFGPNLGDPLFYILPRGAEALSGLDAHRSGKGREQAEALQSQFFAGTPSLGGEIKSKIGLRDWDHEALLHVSQIPGTEVYDPISLFSALRRFYYLDALHFDQTIAMYDEVRALKKVSKDLFRQGAAILSRQNYEVTRRCQEILAPALEIAQSSQKLLQDFMQAEKGHDTLLRRGLEELGADSESAAALPVTAHLLDLFKLNAGANFLALAFTVSIFEETAPDGGLDPLSRLLLENGEEKAAHPFLLHGQINDEGGHEAMGIVLLQNMGPVNLAYATEAIALSEGISKVMNVYTTEIREAILQLKNKLL